MDDLSLKLLKYLNLPEDTQINLKRKSSGSQQQQQQQPDAKKPKTDEEASKNTSVLDLSKPDSKNGKQSTQSAKEKARAKAAGGTKSIASFFTKT